MNSRSPTPLQTIIATNPPPVVWLLGKTQAGKTSIIRSLTGSPDAEIGNGFQPCTRSSRFYDFPEQAPVVRFLDTQGLGEVAYEPEEDIAFCEAQAQLVIAVVSVADVAQDALYDVLRGLRKRRPEWPVIVAQTCLHYVCAADYEHVLPYPFEDDGWEKRVPTTLARVLLTQRERLDGLPGKGFLRWVPVDLTLPEDDIRPHDYGLEALWHTIECASAMQLRERLLGDSDERDARYRKAHPYIMYYSVAAGLVGAVPVVDLALAPALQWRLLRELGRIYGLSWTKAHAAKLGGALGSGFLLGYGVRMVGRELVKLVPGWGQTAGAVWGAAGCAGVTYALGKAACYYLEHVSSGQTPDPEALREAYAQAFKRARSLLKHSTSMTTS